jgi:hypothetical protein
MATQDKREILDMLSAGKITAAEALGLLDQSSSRTGEKKGDESHTFSEKSDDFPTPEQVDAIKVDELTALDEAIKIENIEKPAKAIDTVSSEMEKAPAGNGNRPHWLKIRIRDMDTGRNKVSVNLPLGMVSFGLRVAQRFNTDLGEVNVDEMLTMIKHGERGLIVEVQDDEDNEQVQIYLD